MNCPIIFGKILIFVVELLPLIREDHLSSRHALAFAQIVPHTQYLIDFDKHILNRLLRPAWPQALREMS